MAAAPHPPHNTARHGAAQRSTALRGAARHDATLEGNKRDGICISLRAPR